MSAPDPAATMHAVRLHPDGPRHEQIPIPAPGPGQVLVRMHASPINPNDLLFLGGDYEVVKPLPVVAGFEGSGVVVGAGQGLLPRLLVGRRVAVVAGPGDGTWAEYTCAPADGCVPLRTRVDLDQAAMLLTNPLTAQVLYAKATRGRRRPFVQNAAAGSLGRMITRLAVRDGVPAVHVVRRPAEAESLLALGAEHALATQDPDFDTTLAETCTRLGIDYALDPVAGDDTGRLLAALVPGGTVVVYGKLSGRPCVVDGDDLIFRNKRVEGFTMYTWVAETSKLGQLRMVFTAQGALDGDLGSEIRARIPLARFEEALASLRAESGGGKILLVPTENEVSSEPGAP